MSVRHISFKGMLILVVLMILVALPRFNRNTSIVNAPPRDDVQYQLYVRFFRGEPVEEDLRPASTWRPLVPMVASTLPLNPMSALSVTNLLALAIALLMLVRTCAHIGCGVRLQALAACLFIFSFPMFYYATIGYVDPGAIGLLGIAAFLMVKKRWLWLIPCVVVGAAAKESMFIAVPAGIAFILESERKPKALFLAAGLLVAYVAATVWIRNIVPGPAGPAFWEFKLEALLENASRPKAYLSGLLTFGIPGSLLVGLMFYHRRFLSTVPYLLPLLVGTLGGLAIWSVAFVSAAVDGRTMWAMYPFAIPLVATLLQRHFEEIPHTGTLGHVAAWLVPDPAFGEKSDVLRNSKFVADQARQAGIGLAEIGNNG